MNQALHQWFGWQCSKVFEHQLLDVEPHKMPQLKGAAARGEDKIATPVIHVDQVPLGIESSGPAAPSNVQPGMPRGLTREGPSAASRLSGTVINASALQDTSRCETVTENRTRPGEDGAWKLSP